MLYKIAQKYLTFYTGSNLYVPFLIQMLKNSIFKERTPQQSECRLAIKGGTLNLKKETITIDYYSTISKCTFLFLVHEILYLIDTRSHAPKTEMYILNNNTDR